MTRISQFADIYRRSGASIFGAPLTNNCSVPGLFCPVLAHFISHILIFR